MVRVPDGNDYQSRRGLRIKGVQYTRIFNGKTVYSKWPQPRGPARSPEQANSQELFGLATVVTQYMDPHLTAFAVTVAKGTQLMPRDVLLLALYNRLFTLVRKDGTKIHSMASMQDVSSILDVIAQLQGYILVRGETWWEGLPPGNVDYVLKIGPDGFPVWGLGTADATVNVLDTFTFTNVASVDIDLTPYQTDYHTLEVQLQNCIPVNNGAYLQGRLAQGGPTTWKTGSADYRFALARWSSAPNADSNGGNDNHIVYNINYGIGNQAYGGISVTLHSPSWNTAGFKGRWRWDADYYTDNDLTMREVGALRLEPTGVQDGMQFYFNSGNVASATVKVVGYV